MSEQQHGLAAITPEVRTLHAELLWSEYRYRHDHIWKVLFQLTAATVLLAIAPYIQTQITRVVSYWVLALPILGIFLLLFGTLLLREELLLFSQIKARFRAEQNALLGIEHCTGFGFDRFVYLYLGALCILGLSNLYVLWQVWIPAAISAA
jgi:hypothetical protein